MQIWHECNHIYSILVQGSQQFLRYQTVSNPNPTNKENDRHIPCNKENWSVKSVLAWLWQSYTDGFVVALSTCKNPFWIDVTENLSCILNNTEPHWWSVGTDGVQSKMNTQFQVRESGGSNPKCASIINFPLAHKDEEKTRKNYIFLLVLLGGS